MRIAREARSRTGRCAGYAGAALAVLGVLAATTLALAAWLATGAGAASAASTYVNPGQSPSGTVSGRDVTVAWSASGLHNGAPVGGYVIRRYDGSNVAQTVGSGCAGTVSGLSCSESGVAPGTWKYTVQPVKAGWHGAESAQSAAVSVGSPSLTITSSTTVTSLPATLSGTIAGFLDGETITFHLDSAAGPTLAGTVSGLATPAAVPTGGGAGIAVTVPVGTADGAHTIYAVAAPSAESAPAAITVNTAAPTVVIAFPVGGSRYDEPGWNAGCNPPGVCGTAQAFSGNALVEVDVSVRDQAAGTCWNGADFAASCPNYLAAAGTDSWKFQLNVSKFVDGRTYAATARAADDAGHSTATTAAFTYDVTAPAVSLTRVNGSTVAFPLLTNAQVTSVGGSCGSATGDVATVSVAVTGSQAQSGTASCSFGSWTYTASPPLSADGSYSVVAAQSDLAGNVGSSGTQSISVDRTAPAVTLTSPANGSAVTTSTPTFSGSAGNAAGDGSTITIKVFSGSSTAGALVETLTATRSGTSWSVGANPGLSVGTYTAQATQSDTAGNTGTSSANTFTVALGPTVSVTFPVAGQDYEETYWGSAHGTCAAKSICGTGTASLGTVSSVTVQLKDTTTGVCWNGSANSGALFNQTCGASTFFLATGTTSWSIAGPDGPRLTDGHSYEATAQATDSAGSTNGSPVAFGVDKTAPSVTNVFAANTATTGIGVVQPGGTLRVYATVSDGFSGVNAVTAEGRGTTPLFAGTATLSPCTSSCSIRGQTYNYVSGSLVGSVVAGTAKYRVVATDNTMNANTTTTGDQSATVDGTRPTISSAATTNGPTDGKPEAGDTLSVTYSETLSVPSICSAWTGTDTASGTITSQTTVTFQDNFASGHDVVALTSSDCTLHMGSFDLGGNGYVKSGNVTFTNSTIAWDGATKVTITLGTQGGAGTPDVTGSNTTITYTPDAAVKDVAGNVVTGSGTSPSTKQF
ncbi:MAG: beta strand repeat-containing protein [Actinomycetota bacterium]